MQFIGVGRGGWGMGGGGPPNNFEVPTYSLTFPPSNNPPTFSFNVSKNSITYVPVKLNRFTKSILYNSIPNFAIVSVFNVKNVILWH